MHKNNVSRELKSWLVKCELKVDGVGVHSKPSIPEDLGEKEELIKLLKSKNRNLDSILSSYQNKRKQEKLKLVKKKVDEIQAEDTTEHTNDKDMAPVDNEPINITKERKKNKSQLANPKIENWEPPCVARSTTNVSSLVNSSSVYHCIPPIVGLELKFNKHKRIGVGDKDSLLKGEKLNENNSVYFCD